MKKTELTINRYFIKGDTILSFDELTEQEFEEFRERATDRFIRALGYVKKEA